MEEHVKETGRRVGLAGGALFTCWNRWGMSFLFTRFGEYFFKMSLGKILLFIGIIALLGVALIVYSLSPTIKTLSNHPALKSFVGNELEVKREGQIILVEEGQYAFTSNILTQELDYPGRRVATVSAGDKIIIKEFKTHRNNLGAGITRLYAVGQFIHEGIIIRFEYSLGTLNDESDATNIVPHTIWQNEGDEQIVLHDIN